VKHDNADNDVAVANDDAEEDFMGDEHSANVDDENLVLDNDEHNYDSEELRRILTMKHGSMGLICASRVCHCSIRSSASFLEVQSSRVQQF
jgi:hypothetical protein